MEWIVMADGGLNMREIPDKDGKVTLLIPEYGVVEFIEESGETISIKDRTGKWTNQIYSRYKIL